MLSNGKENKNLLENISLLTTDQFNTEYLVNPDPSVDNITKLSELNTENQTEDFFSFYDDSKHNHKCIISIIY